MTLRTLTATIPLSLAMLCSSASAATIFLENNTAQLYSGDPATGVFTLVGSTGLQLTDIAFSPQGVLYGIDGASLYTVNASTGAVTLVGADTGATDFLNALAIGPGGTIYAAGGDDLYKLDATTGAATLIGSGSDSGGDAYNSAGDLSFNAGTLYLTSGAPSAGDQLFSVSPTTGIGHDIGPIDVNDVFGLASVGGVLLGYTAEGQELTINTTLGVGHVVFSNVPDTFGAAVQPTPEPGTAGAILLGLTGLVTVIRRRRA